MYKRLSSKPWAVLVACVVLLFLCSCLLLVVLPPDSSAHQLLGGLQLQSGYTCIVSSGHIRYLRFGDTCPLGEPSGPFRPADALLFNVSDVLRRLYHSL